MKKLARQKANILTTIDQCQYGLWIEDTQGWTLVKKPTKFLTNPPGIAQQLQQRCPGKKSHASQRHASLFNGRSKMAQVYPEKLCDAICKGIKQHIEYDRKGKFLLTELKIEDPASARTESRYILGNIAEGKWDNGKILQSSPRPTVTEDTEEELQQAWDDVSGRELNAAKVREARALEVQYIHKTKLYTKVPRDKAKQLSAKVISVRWVDINKGDADTENYRSRLVAREIKRDNRLDLFAATPPLEALTAIISMCTSCIKGEKIMVNDVSRAYFCAPARRQVFVELAEEDKIDGEDMIGELNYSMYGTRDAAQNWGEECAATMEKAGFTRGKASPCTFNHHYRRLKCYVHGDDFVTVGLDKDLKWMRAELEKAYELKTHVLGPDKEDLKQVRVLNRVLTWSSEGTSYEADPRHAEIVINDLGLKDAKGVVAPGTKEEGTTKTDHE